MVGFAPIGNGLCGGGFARDGLDCRRPAGARRRRHIR
jgi:hypothetical protein